jgi:hypothetical protein
MWVLQFAYNKSISRRNYLSVRQFYSHTRLDDVAANNAVWDLLQRPASQECARLIAEVLATLNEQQRQTIEMVFVKLNCRHPGVICTPGLRSNRLRKSVTLNALRFVAHEPEFRSDSDGTHSGTPIRLLCVVPGQNSK